MHGGPIPEPDSIRALVNRIAASKLFARAPSLVQLLRFTAEEMIQGRGAALMEYRIATEAFGRGPDFDSKVDTIVRVQAGKVRAKLKKYFESEGRDEPIEYPLGGYVPIFRLLEEAAQPPHRRPWWMDVA